jgi:hypothetical protein
LLNTHRDHETVGNHLEGEAKPVKRECTKQPAKQSNWCFINWFAECERVKLCNGSLCSPAATHRNYSADNCAHYGREF